MARLLAIKWPKWMVCYLVTTKSNDTYISTFLKQICPIIYFHSCCVIALQCVTGYCNRNSEAASSFKAIVLPVMDAGFYAIRPSWAFPLLNIFGSSWINFWHGCARARSHMERQLQIHSRTQSSGANVWCGPVSKCAHGQTHVHAGDFRSPCQNRLGRALRTFGWEPEVRGNPCWQAHRQWNSTHQGVSQIISAMGSFTHPEPSASDQRPLNHHTSIHLALLSLSLCIYLIALTFRTLNQFFVSQQLLAFPFLGAVLIFIFWGFVRQACGPTKATAPSTWAELWRKVEMLYKWSDETEVS